MIKVHLVFFSYDDSLNADCTHYTTPEIVGAFQCPKAARKWVRKQRKEHEHTHRQRFSYKVLKVT